MKITKREIILSISIFSVMMIIGVLISDLISDLENDKVNKYNTAIEIADQELFEYCMSTNVGDAFVYGTLSSKDPIVIDEIDGEYLLIQKNTEKYTKHTRIVNHTRTVNGKTKVYYTTEEYWTWDIINRETDHCKELLFCGNRFDYGKIDVSNVEHIDTIKISPYIRYKFYGFKNNVTGTIFTTLKDSTISDNSKFFQNLSTEETKEFLNRKYMVPLFWIIWSILIVVLIVLFYRNENRWLE